MTTTIDGSGVPSRSLLPFLDREHTVARPGYSRWMVPPAALCVHLCIGQAYAFSVFNLPMTKLLGVSQSTPADWKLTELGWIFSIAMVFLGLHLYHGAWSSIRTLGYAKTAVNPLRRRLALAVAVIVWLGFTLVPLGVVAGFIR